VHVRLLGHQQQRARIEQPFCSEKSAIMHSTLPKTPEGAILASNHRQSEECRFK
jgi:hypothetical protein